MRTEFKTSETWLKIIIIDPLVENLLWLWPSATAPEEQLKSMISFTARNLHFYHEHTSFIAIPEGAKTRQ